MLTEALLMLVQALALGLVMFFPNYAIPQGPGFSALAAANIVLPLDTWAVCMGATIAAMGAAFTVWALMKAWNMIRGSGA
jgi:hypothetical protein